MYVTGDMWQMRGDMWSLTHDKWHVSFNRFFVFSPHWCYYQQTSRDTLCRMQDIYTGTVENPFITSFYYLLLFYVFLHHPLLLFLSKLKSTIRKSVQMNIDLHSISWIVFTFSLWNFFDIKKPEFLEYFTSQVQCGHIETGEKVAALPIRDPTKPWAPISDRYLRALLENERYFDYYTKESPAY